MATTKMGPGLKIAASGWAGPVITRLSSVLFRIYQAVFDGIDRQLGAVFQVQLAQDIADVGLDSLVADEKLLADGQVAVAFGYQPDDLALALGQLLYEGCSFGLSLVGHLFHQFARNIGVQAGLAAVD